eukprot:24500-Lingulodinium_polyedra.AAC.1
MPLTSHPQVFAFRLRAPVLHASSSGPPCVQMRQLSRHNVAPPRTLRTGATPRVSCFNVKHAAAA